MLEQRWCMAAAVPAFESMPGAAHTVYLDFSGQTVENTSWNSYYNQTTLVAKPFDIDGDTNTFSATELSRIEEAYLRVAEDFRPFNVNVTTVEPASDRLQKSTSTDPFWGVRVIVTNESTMVDDPNEMCGCGGIAYINSFNSNIDMPVWVFTSGGKSIAEAASHEVGHALGLSHDGTSTAGYYSGHGSGDVGWASIMGVGYYKNVTQWDDGTFYDSTNTGSSANYGKGADDLVVITTYNGFGYRADDNGNTSATASPLSVAGTVVLDSGVIERTDDVDAYSFTTGDGPISLNINSFSPGPNLDIQADIYDYSNRLIATSNPTSGLNASFAMTLPAGQYYLLVRGVGVGDPTSSTPTGYSSYGSLGAYTITGNIVDPGQVAQLSVNDIIVNEAAGTATFTVTLSGTASGDVTVDYGTVSQTASAPLDYTSAAGSLIFQVGGPSTRTVTVPINDDNIVEGNETFSLNLSGAVGAILADGQGVATIVDNDANVAIGNASANEGNLAKGKKNSGSTSLKDMVFSITLTNAVDHDVTMQWSTADNTATTGDGDYVAASGTAVIRAGDVATTIVVQVIGDGTNEPDETFFVTLNTVTGATVTDGVATGTILDDDSSKGGGRPQKSGKSSPDSIVVADEFWYFEPMDHDHGDDKYHDLEPTAPHIGLAIQGALQETDELLNRETRDDRSVLSTDAIDQVMRLVESLQSDNWDSPQATALDQSDNEEADSPQELPSESLTQDKMAMLKDLILA